MFTSIFAVFATLMVVHTKAGLIGPHHSGVILVGPSGIVTPNGPIGPDGHGPTGGYDGGDDGSYYGHGIGIGNGFIGGAGHGYGHGVAVKGPQPVPAIISGPSGKIIANGLYGVPSHHYGYYHG